MRIRCFLACTLLAHALLAQQPVQPANGAAQASVHLSGRVRDGLTGKPVYDCLVAYYDTAGVRRWVTPVNSDGAYSLFIPAAARFELRVERENGYADLRRPVQAPPEGVAAWEVDLVLDPK